MSRINDVTLFKQALNMKTPTIFDTFRDGDREDKVIDPFSRRPSSGPGRPSRPG
jgi:hypothetical protein